MTGISVFGPMQRAPFHLADNGDYVKCKESCQKGVQRKSFGNPEGEPNENSLLVHLTPSSGQTATVFWLLLKPNRPHWALGISWGNLAKDMFKAIAKASGPTGRCVRGSHPRSRRPRDLRLSGKTTSLHKGYIYQIYKMYISCMHI